MSNSVPGLAEALFGAVMLFSDVRGPWIGYVLVAMGVYFAIRGYRMAVETREDVVTVRGLLRTVRIERARVREVTELPAIRWVDGRGRKRWSPVTCFITTPGVMSRIRHHNSHSVRVLHQWVAAESH